MTFQKKWTKDYLELDDSYIGEGLFVMKMVESFLFHTRVPSTKTEDGTCQVKLVYICIVYFRRYTFECIMFPIKKT